MPKSNYLVQANDYWQSGQALEAGRLIFENLPEKSRAKWAANILRLVVERTKVELHPIERILQITENPKDWNKAHKAFSAARGLVLELDKLKVRSPDQVLLHRVLLLAELVAKVTYNSTDPPDEFDEDSGWWVAVCLKEVLDFLKDDAFSKKMWSALCFEQK